MSRTIWTVCRGCGCDLRRKENKYSKTKPVCLECLRAERRDVFRGTNWESFVAERLHPLIKADPDGWKAYMKERVV